VSAGTAMITPSGTDYADSEISRRGELFREAATERVLLLGQIVRAIEAKSDHTVSEELFHDMLDEQFTEEETTLQLETAVNWGRYAQLFDFDASRGCFVQAEKRRPHAQPSAESVT
jgi:NitT/TauT family transport system ATP-binding protein